MCVLMIHITRLCVVPAVGTDTEVTCSFEEKFREVKKNMICNTFYQCPWTQETENFFGNHYYSDRGIRNTNYKYYYNEIIDVMLSYA